MQSVYFKEVEAAYLRRRVQDAVAASKLAAQATSRSTRNRRPFFPSLVLACLRACEVFQRQRPVLGPITSGRELPAA
jgi:hypothetical protein